MRGFLYDWWLQGTGSLDGVRAATSGGRGRSAQWNLHTGEVEIVNRGEKAVSENEGVVRVEGYDLLGNRLKFVGGGTEIEVDVAVGEVGGGEVGRSERVLEVEQKNVVAFVMLDFDGYKKWYWRKFNAEGEETFNYEELGKWRDQGPYGNVVMQCYGNGNGNGNGNGKGQGKGKGKGEEGGHWKVKVKVKVTGDSLLFAPTFAIFDAEGRAVLPIFVEGGAIVVRNDGEEVIFDIRARGGSGRGRGRVEMESWAGRKVVAEIQIL